MSHLRSKLVTMATERLPPEIITDILRRLPSKSLGRFKCVSKDWLALISQPQFIKTHQKTLNRNHLFFFNFEYRNYLVPFNHYESLEAISSPPTRFRLELPCFYMLTFYGSSNGLVLLSTRQIRMYQRDMLVILNPTTREFLELPSTHDLYGFGYDALTDDYKVFSIRYSDLMFVQVYSLRTKTSNFVTMKDSPYHPNEWSWRSVFVNGFFHWIANKKKDESNEYLPVILAFSLADEELTKVPSPNGVDINYNCTLAAMGEKLAIFLEADGEVWLMNDYGIGESWTNILAHNPNPVIPVIQPRILYDDGKILLVSNRRMLIFDVEKSSFCGSIEFAMIPDLLDVMCIFSESLVSPNFSC